MTLDLSHDVRRVWPGVRLGCVIAQNAVGQRFG